MTKTVTKRIEIEDEIIHSFTSSDCWVLAVELHKLTGLPLVAFTCGNDPFDWNHMAVQVAEDTFLDIEGFHSNDDFINDYWCNRNDECEQSTHVIDIDRWHHLVSLTDEPYYCVKQGQDFFLKVEDGNNVAVADIARAVTDTHLVSAT